MRAQHTAVYFLFTLVVIVSPGTEPEPDLDPHPILVTDLVFVLFFLGFFFLLF